MIFNQQKSFKIRQLRLKKFGLKEIELNFSRKCNLKCEFCPHSNTKYQGIKFQNYMSSEILKKTLYDLKLESIFYEIAGMGEPFLNPEFKKLIKIMNSINNKSFFTIITNGIIFKNNFNYYYKILNISYKLNKLREVKISCYSPSIFNFFKNKKIPWISIKKSYGENLEKYKKLFNNRAGSISLFKKNYKIPSTCNYCFFFAMIDTDGDVSFCPHEWEKRLVQGNILNQNIIEIWNSGKINKIRSIMINNDRQNFYPCNICTTPGILIGNEAKEDYEKRQNTKTKIQ